MAQVNRELKKFLFVGGPVHGKILEVLREPVIKMPRLVVESKEEYVTRLSMAWDHYVLTKVIMPYGHDEVYVEVTATSKDIEDAYWKNWMDLIAMRGISDT